MVGELVCEVVVGRPLQLTLWWDRGLLDHIDLAWAGNGEGADAPAFSKWGRVVEEALHKYVRGEAVQWPDLPYRWERTTEFRTRVLKELQNVPAGETLSYGELAKRVGSPRASRAVGGCMHILAAYETLDRNKTQTAKQLGIGLATLQRKLKAYGVK